MSAPPVSGGSPTTLDAAAARALVEQRGARLVDVRTAGEFGTRHIPGSSNVPLDVLRSLDLRGNARHDDPVVLVCASGARAEQARTLLSPAGLTQVVVLEGGLAGWERAGQEVAEGRGAWAMERQVRLVAGSLVLTGVLASLRHRRAVALAGVIGAGLTFSALTDTCGMARVLSLLPHNRAGAPDPVRARASVLG